MSDARRNQPRMGSASLGAALSEANGRTNHIAPPPAAPDDGPEGFENETDGDQKSADGLDVDRVEVRQQTTSRRRPPLRQPPPVIDEPVDEADGGPVAEARPTLRDRFGGRVARAKESWLNVRRFASDPAKRRSMFKAAAVAAVVLIGLAWLLLPSRKDPLRVSFGISTSGPQQAAAAVVPGQLVVPPPPAQPVLRRYAVVRQKSHAWSSTKSEPLMIVDDNGIPHVIPKAYVDAVDQWIDGQTVAMPESFSLWAPSTMFAARDGHWLACVAQADPREPVCWTADGSADLYSTVVFAR